MVFQYAVTEQDEAISCEQFEFREQIPSARPVREPDKEQAKTELETSVMESLAVRQQSDPDIGKLVQLRLQSQKQPALLCSQPSQRALKDYITNGSAWKYERARTTKSRRKAWRATLFAAIVPRQSVQHVLRSCHEGGTRGHFGIQRTLDQVKRRIFAGSPGRKTRSASVSDATPAMNITEGSYATACYRWRSLRVVVCRSDRTTAALRARPYLHPHICGYLHEVRTSLSAPLQGSRANC